MAAPTTRPEGSSENPGSGTGLFEGIPMTEYSRSGIPASCVLVPYSAEGGLFFLLFNSLLFGF